MCFFSAGMLADFLDDCGTRRCRLMEVECRSRGDSAAGSVGNCLMFWKGLPNGHDGGASYAEALGG